MDLLGKTALITGGKRIGAVVARTLAVRGVDVAFSYSRSKEEADQAAEAVRAAGRRAAVFQADLSNPAAPAACRPLTVLVSARYCAFQPLAVNEDPAASARVCAPRAFVIRP